MSGGSGMGWRDVIAKGCATTKDQNGAWAIGRGTYRRADAIHSALLSMPAPARIALARELLAGVGYRAVVIPDEWDIQGEFGDGWNACRAAMMEAGAPDA